MMNWQRRKDGTFSPSLFFLGFWKDSWIQINYCWDAILRVNFEYGRLFAFLIYFLFFLPRFIYFFKKAFLIFFIEQSKCKI